MLLNPLASYLINKIGRKSIIILADIPYLISWVITANTHSIYLFYLARVFVGLGHSFLLIGLPAYIGEISSPKIRGRWGSLSPFNVSFGSLVVNILGGYSGIKTSAYIMMILPLISILTFSFMPESPYYLLMVGKQEKAEISLRRLRRKSDVTEELFLLKRTFEKNRSKKFNLFKIFKSETDLKALKITLFARVAQITSGITVFVAYTQYFFQQVGGYLTPTLSSIILSSAVLLMIAPSSFLVEKVGRRISMIFSCGFCSLMLASMALYFYLHEFTTIDLSRITWYPLVGLVFYLVGHYLGLGLTPNLLILEMFHTNVKAECLAILNISSVLCVIVINKLFPLLYVHFGMYLPFLLLFLTTAVATVLSILWLPETKGKTLEEIQFILQGKKNVKTSDNMIISDC